MSLPAYYDGLKDRLNKYSAEHENHGGITAEAADAIEHLAAAIDEYEDGIVLSDKIMRDLRLKIPKWVPCSEGKPKRGEKVLVYAVGKRAKITPVIVISSRYVLKLYSSLENGIEQWKEPWQYFREDYEITHWMPMPQAPEEGDKR